ncbi:hypothetical protein [Nitrosomonas sp. Nm34]|uniref:hypothetical protein n=1 Tax=Nitrosomonas sp. Nm34 TaxID=1881055 RepID=UPI0008F283E3|nr:hypothetical protein [Nitrosomonas sp. Nm34]SFI61029.1 hypothetical protein SAMN05428978_10206 [Nitrosomonas sp. Nm34]
MSKVSLLAPVPLEHLIEGVEVCEKQGKVAFGSCAWEVFRDLDMKAKRDCNDALFDVDVFIYASGDPNAERLEVSWYGKYIRHVESKNGTHPEGMRFRPPSTGKYSSDNSGHWAIFWEIQQLRQLKQDERYPSGAFIGYTTDKAYKKNFIPKGPLLVRRPIEQSDPVDSKPASLSI